MAYVPNSGGAWSQPGVVKEKANGDLLYSHTNESIFNRQISSGSAHPLSERSDDVPHRAELSFRIDLPSEMMSSPYTMDTFGMDSLRQSSDISPANGFHSVADFAKERDLSISIFDNKSQLSLQQSNADMQFTSFDQVDVREKNMWKNNRYPRMSGSDVWMPESNDTELRGRGLANADYVEERLMKFGTKNYSGSPYKGQELPKFPFQDNDLSKNVWLSRESQSQSLSSRKLSRSVNGSSNNMSGFNLERSTIVPRYGPFVNREEDLYSSLERMSAHKGNHQSQTDVCSQQKFPQVPQLEEELYPSMSSMMNYRQAAAFNKGYTANSFPSNKGADSHTAAFEGAMMNYAPIYSNPHLQNFQYDGSFTGLPDYSMRSFAGPYDHPYSRFQERNGQFSGDSYPLQLSSCDDAYNFTKSLHQPPGHPLVSQREMALVSTSNNCTCCKEHNRLQPPSLPFHGSFKPHPLSQYPPLGYQHLQPHSHFQDYMTTYGKHSARSSQNSVRSPQLRRKAPDPLSQAVRARKENCPPLPGLSAPPYVLCQGCGMVVQIHVQHYFEGTVLKLRCSACRRISKFCNIMHPCYQGLLKMGRATSSMQRSDNSGSFDTQKLLSTVATGGTIAQNSAVQEVESAKLNEDNKSSCVLNGQHDGQHKQFEANATPVGVQNFDNFMPKMTVEQGPYEDENSLNPWSRSGTFHEDSSSLFSVSGSVSTKNTAGLKSHESQQLETYVELVSDCLPPEESVQAKDPSIEANSTFEQQTASGPIVSSKELQGLMLECLQQNPSDEVKLNRKESFTLKRNQFHQDKCNEPVRLSNDTSSSPSEQIGCQNQDLGHGEAEVSNNGANFNVNGPAPGSPLYKYLSFDAGSEIGETFKHDIEVKQAVVAPCNRDTFKGPKFFPSFLKKNIQLGNAGHGNNKNASVVVNGTIITLDAIKRAEKQAGAIRPGVYWYDYEAGFWGVLGGPCLGIIPPFIAEFKSPLVQSCAGGTTDVFVNGRELHRKDLDALAGRGLPRIPGKSYMVNISGQVVDKSSGQMLRSLGRLAPTVEKRGRGCGMFQPPTLS